MLCVWRLAVDLHTSSSSDVVDDTSVNKVKLKKQQQQQQSNQPTAVAAKLADCLKAFTQQERVIDSIQEFKQIPMKWVGKLYFNYIFRGNKYTVCSKKVLWAQGWINTIGGPAWANTSVGPSVAPFPEKLSVGGTNNIYCYS